MYSLKTSASFDSAHFLSGYQGKCANIHGHRWVIEVTVSGSDLQQSGEKRGMLVDFSDIKHAVRSLANSLDHALIIENNSLKEKILIALREEGFRIIEFPFRPTAENFAQHFYFRLKEIFPVAMVTVYETPENCASYREDSPC